MCNKHVTSENWRPSWLKWQIGQPLLWNRSDSVHLDLGSGKRPANPFNAAKLFASDIQDLSTSSESYNYEFCKISNISKISLDDQSVDSVSAYDLLEHIPRSWPGSDNSIRYPFIELMNEVSRVLKPGGIFIAVTPAFPSPQSFQDPTHVNIISDETISYFDENAWARQLGYGFMGSFTRLHQSWLRGAAPYIGRYEENVRPSQFYKLKNQNIIHKIRILNRLRLLLTLNKPYSLLWILRKNCETENKVRENL